MDAIEALNTRRSIRKFKEGKISKDTINKILGAGMSAPSAINEQPWHFVVITEKNILEKIPELHPHASMATKATIAILVCGDLNLE
ncbi:MAG: nitroreductase family protein, partial [Candidatus Omnitrophica bacterium]|nr:nitroreductase family protein [Candidatus Omnitrophota bacterium]